MITFSVNNDLGAGLSYLLNLQQRLEEPRDFLETVGIIVRDSAKERFSTKQDPDGDTWEDLKESTKKQKLRTNRSNAENVLVKSGRLGRDIIFDIINNHSVKVGSVWNYGIHHQFGTRKMAKRSFLGISSDDEFNIRDALNEFLAEQARS